MPAGHERERLRRLLLERRDRTSADLLGIAAERIRARLRKIGPYRDARRVGAYHPIGSEIDTRGIMQELLSSGREVCLPAVAGGGLEFRRVSGPADLEEGALGIMEPRGSCAACAGLDAVLVPAVGVSAGGARLGYGRGHYDRYRAGSGAARIALALEKQVCRIPEEPHDAPMDWVVTEDRTIRTGRS